MNRRSELVFENAYSGGALYRALRIVAFAAFTGIGAQLAVRLPFTPVPFTMQTLFVVLAGIVLGSRDGFYAMVAYVTIGAAGVPWFANFTSGPLILMGITGGYIASFPFAAWIAGRIFESSDRGRVAVFFASITGSSLILIVGASYLASAFGLGISTAFTLGILPFVSVELLKAGLAALLPLTK